MYTVTAILMSGQEMILGSDASARAARKSYNGAISMPGVMTLRIIDPAGNSITMTN